MRAAVGVSGTAQREAMTLGTPAAISDRDKPLTPLPVMRPRPVSQAVRDRRCGGRVDWKHCGGDHAEQRQCGRGIANGGTRNGLWEILPESRLGKWTDGDSAWAMDLSRPIFSQKIPDYP